MVPENIWGKDFDFWEKYLPLLHRVLNAKSKKIEKNGHADRLISPAVKWAEMAADHENGQNSKISFSQNHGHYVAS